MLCFRALILALSALKGGCITQLAEPDLERLYAHLANKPKYPVIVTPGTFSSRLVDANTGDTPDAITLAGAAKVRKTVLIGTTNYGSVTALQMA